MASRNPDSVAGQGEFHARVPRAEPVDPNWVKPGNERGDQARPTFHAETHEPGTAPKEASFRPNPGQEDIDNNPYAQRRGADPLASLPGSTDRDLYNATDSQHGRPLTGQESRETRGVHAGRHKKEHGGLEGVGASSADDTVEGKAHAVRADRE